jgi:hypothetical protein
MRIPSRAWRAGLLLLLPLTPFPARGGEGPRVKRSNESVAGASGKVGELAVREVKVAARGGAFLRAKTPPYAEGLAPDADAHPGQLPGLLVAHLGVDADKIADRLEKYLRALGAARRGGGKGGK